MISEPSFSLDEMKQYILSFAQDNNCVNTFKALAFAEKAHKGQKRLNGDIPYIYHPVNLACHCLMMDIGTDEILSAALLHDVVEDCGVKLEELPVNEETKIIVRLLTKEDGYVNDEYYHEISLNTEASLLKCLDRVNNLTTMSSAFNRDFQLYYIHETEKYILPLLETVRKKQEYEKAAWLLEYQLKAMCDIYGHLL